MKADTSNKITFCSLSFGQILIGCVKVPHETPVQIFIHHPGLPLEQSCIINYFSFSFKKSLLISRKQHINPSVAASCKKNPQFRPPAKTDDLWNLWKVCLPFLASQSARPASVQNKQRLDPPPLENGCKGILVSTFCGIYQVFTQGCARLMHP